MVLVLLSAHADGINVNFFFCTSCVITVCLVKGQWWINRLLWTVWSSFDHLLSSNLWVNNCQWHPVMTHFPDVIYRFPRSTSITAGCQNCDPFFLSSSHLLMNSHTPWTVSSWLTFTFSQPLHSTVMEALVLGTEVKSLMGDLTLGWLWFPSKQCCGCGSWVIEHYWF